MVHAMAIEFGASWADGAGQPPPEELDAAIIFVPVGPLLREVLAQIAPGGIVVCAGINLSDILTFPYSLLRGGGLCDR